MQKLSIILAIALFASSIYAQEYPLTIEHKFGTTIIESKPERVASVDYNGADNLLSLGIQPVTVRYWYGDYERAVWPWADELLEETPEILEGELNFEQIAAAEPDVIVAIWSGITPEEYDRLSLIAPVVAVPEGVGDYALPWDELAILAGRAVGLEDEAKMQVEAIRNEFETIAARNPDWQGKTATVAYYFDDGPGAYTSEDIRPQILSLLGLETPEGIMEEAEEGSFAITISEERLDLLDSDVLIWFADDTREEVENLALRPSLTAFQEGREIFSDALLTSAFSHGSLLSLPYALERLEPMIKAAIDGDPETEMPTD